MDQLATDDRRIGDVDRPTIPPLVSIVITNFNYERFLKTAVQSVEAQIYQRWECVIVDDCSTDGSLELITRYLNSVGDDRFRCQRMDENSGQLAACLAGLKATSGSFVVFLDADDYLLPDFLDTHVRSHLNSTFSAALTASDMLLVDGEGSVIEGTCAWLNKGGLDPAGVVPAAEIPKLIGDERLDYQNTFSLRYIDRHYPHAFAATSSIMFRRTILELIAPEEVEFCRLHADYYLALFAHLISGTLLISSFHAAYRIYGKNGFGKSLIGGNHSVGTIRRITAHCD